MIRGTSEAKRLSRAFDVWLFDEVRMPELCLVRSVYQIQSECLHLGPSMWSESETVCQGFVM